MIFSFVFVVIIYINQRRSITTITATELKNNLGKYLILAATEDIFITKNGKTIAKLTSPYQNKLDTVDALFGSIPDTITFEEARKEQLSKV